MTNCYTLNSTAKDVVQANTNLSISESHYAKVLENELNITIEIKD